MRFYHNSIITSVLMGLLIVSQMSCNKDDIAPAKQQVAFVKYFGYIESQKSSDLKRTSDGGYLMLGTTNSYSTKGRNDMLLVKTDSLGNEEWSQMYGSPTQGADANEETYDEEGVKIIVLPDQVGYLIAGNRTQYIGGVQGPTKIVLYLLDLSGAIVNGPVVLRNSAAEAGFNEKVTDILYHQDTIIGINSFVLTGQTSNIKTNKPNGIKPTDQIDMLIMRLDENFGSIWPQGQLAYGFDGNDYGYSLHIINNQYVLIGTDQQSANSLQSHIRMVEFKSLNGAVSNTDNFAVASGSVGRCYSQLDDTKNLITVVASLVDDNNNSPNYDDLLMMQVDYNLVEKTPLTVLGIPSISNQYLNLEVSSLALVTSNDGYVVSFTNNRSEIDSEIGIAKVNSNLELEEDWPYLFGYEGVNILDGTLERAGVVIPSVEQIAGTNQTQITGYVFTGAFGLGTNSMMGLVKINDRGTLEPE